MDLLMRFAPQKKDPAPDPERDDDYPFERPN